MKTIVISAVNLRKGGTLTILRDCLDYLSQLAETGDYRVVALVHDKKLAFHDNIEYIEMPWTIRSWWARLWCEYVTMYRLSKRLAPVYLWLSLHDASPRVVAERRAVYCHNPFPFFHCRPKDVIMNWRIAGFSLFSKYIYRINIHRNYRIIVQQQWLKEEFKRMFNLSSNKIIVAPPAPLLTTHYSLITNNYSLITKFLFPSFGDIHKNFETACEAARLLEAEVGRNKFQLIITINGSENRYTRWIHKRWGDVSSIRFAGFMSREELYSNYASADCLVFPSLVETWGLPISEFAAFGKPMLLADLPYAHETAAGSRNVAFFTPKDANKLKELMANIVCGDTSLTTSVEPTTIEPPLANSWRELFNQLIV